MESHKSEKQEQTHRFIEAKKRMIDSYWGLRAEEMGRCWPKSTDF